MKSEGMLAVEIIEIDRQHLAPYANQASFADKPNIPIKGW